MLSLKKIAGVTQLAEVQQMTGDGSSSLLTCTN
jgi:hypothetical protein